MKTYPGVLLADRFFAGTGVTYDLMVNLCTLGMDWWWKREILNALPIDPKYIVDQACGTGILTFKIALKFPRCRVLGVELRNEYLCIARKKAANLKLTNVGFILGRAEDILSETPCDCITSSYLVKYAELQKLIPNAKKMLRSGGSLILHEFIYPRNKTFARLWELYFRLLQTVGSKLYPTWRTIFHELPVLLHYSQWLSELMEALRTYGFVDITIRRLTFGTSVIVTAKSP
jgi:demethylmenaquinone methyltransferase / 2-methoxy-6-polyprenyl-1,4-benzoquinol methylase